MIGLSGGLGAVEILKNSKCPFCNAQSKLVLINAQVKPTIFGIPYNINPLKIRENWTASCLECGRKVYVSCGIATKLLAKEGKSAQRNK